MYKLLIISFAFLLTVACTKQRESQFAQGQGENLLSVSSYDGKTFEIKTGAAIEGKKQAFSKAQQLEIKSKAVGEDSFAVVNYEVSDSLAKTLLGDTAIVGRPNTTYQGLIKVEQNYVKVYKVAKATDLPLSETTYATKLSGDMLAVPLIGYPITSRVSIDRSKNEYNEKSSTKIEKSEVDISKASHFRIDMSRSELFEPVQKTDVLPSSFFDGEWFYTETVTAAAEEQSENLGFTGGYDQSLTPSTRIKFLSNETTLRVVNLNIDERLTQKADINYKTALEIPVEWKSYKVSSNGQGMAEQEDGKVHWSKRPFVQVGFDKAISFINKGKGRLVSLEVRDDYFSFAIEDSNNGRIRYSFLKANKRDYVAKRLFKEDKRLFGFFETEKAVVNNFEISRQEDVQKNIFISRFNPRGGKIVFNFTKTTPQWIRPTVLQAVKYWDEAFKAAGVKNLDIVLDETKDVELGDLRYNAINVIENLTASNLFGFGPSVTDPFTGEIISATTNVHLTPIREAIIDEVKNYVKMKMGLLQQGRSIGVSSLLAVMQSAVLKQSGQTLSVASDYFPELKGLKAYLPDDKNPNKYTLQTIDFRKRTKAKAAEFDIAMASGNIHADIEAQCSEIVDYVKELQSQKVTHNDKENSVLDSCSRKLVVGKFMGTLVHEMGHNFGLRHNFMGSNDSANFLPAEVTGTKHQVRSSSVMEYASFNEDRLVKPGTYDVAAIRFGYADAIELKDGKIAPLNVKASIEQNLKAQNAQAHTFKFCTDEDVAYSTDPMCQRHDSGVTPLEVVKNIIADYQASVELLNFRGDAIRSVSPARLQIYRLTRFMLPLSRFYEEWRTGLARYLGQDDQYLERMSVAEMDATVKKMAADPQYAEFVKQYKPVADSIFGFFFQVATMENRYCVMRKDDGTGIKMQELENVRQQTYFNKGQSIANCAEAEKAGYWKGSGLGLMTEVGHSLNSFRYDLSDKAASEPLDVIGTQGDRMMATIALAMRSSWGYDADFRGFTPSFLDEPGYRATMQNYLLSRAIQGVPGSYISRYLPLNNPNLSADDKAGLTELKKFMDQQSFPMFGSEKELIKLLAQTYMTGVQLAGKAEANTRRLTPIEGIYIPASQSAALKDVLAYAPVPNGFFAVTNKNAKGALALIQAYRNIGNMKNAQVVDLKDAKIAALVKELSAGLPTDAELKSMSFQQMITKLAPLKETVKKATEDKASPMGAQLVAEVRAILSVADKIAEVKASGNAEGIQQMDAILAAPFLEVAQEQLKMPGFPTVETFQKTLESQNAAAAYYKENTKELDAQADLLTSIMLTLGN